MRPHRFLFALMLAAASSGAVALPIDKFVTVQPIAVCDDLGFGCANADGILASTAAVTNAVWAQAGIAVSFLPTRRFNDSDFLITDVNPGNAATDEGRRLLRTPGQQQSANPTTINMYFVPQLRDASNGYANLNGFGFINGNGIIIGGAPRLDTIAHELGHNLGLDHGTLGAGAANNLMTDGAARSMLGSIADVAPNGGNLAQLGAAQIARARQPLFSVNQFSVTVTDGGYGLIPGLRLYDAYSPMGAPNLGSGYLLPGDPRLPPASERLKSIRIRFLPGSNVRATLFAGFGMLDALRDPGAVFDANGSIASSPYPVGYYYVDPAPVSPAVQCPLNIQNCPDVFFPIAEQRVLADGTEEHYWQLDGDSFGQFFEYRTGAPDSGPIQPAAQRKLPPFTPWDIFQIMVWDAANPFAANNVPQAFSLLYEFSSGLASQGFFDANGVASTLDPTTIVTFIEEPSYGFVSDLRPDPNPEVEVSPADVPAPPAATLLLMALAGLAVVRPRRLSPA